MDAKLENVSFSYNLDLSSRSYALKDIGFRIAMGGFALICGRSGSGKTTLAQIIAGLIKPTSGKVFYNDMDIIDPASRELKKQVGMIFQTPEQQLFERTVYEDITFVKRRSGNYSESELEDMANDTLKTVGLDIVDYKDRISFTLSTGEKRKAAIACVLINAPRLIILDEPTVGLDHFAKKSLIKIITKLKNDGKTIICISHDIDDFIDISDNILILKKGELIFSGNQCKFYNDYSILKDEVRYPDVIRVAHELKRLENSTENSVFSRSEALFYLKNLIKKR